MIRVLQCVNNMHRAGLETILMNYYRAIDRTQIQFDFLMHRDERSDYDDEIEQLGGRIYRAPRLYPQNYPAYFRFMKRFFSEHPEYKIVHSHIDAMSYLPLMAAKRAKVPVRIAHSHSTNIDKDAKFLLKQLFRFCLRGEANVFWACGESAGRFLFGERKADVVPNAVHPDKFLYDNNVRVDVRKELGVKDAFVIGHVGRFTYAKNHCFLVDIFASIQEIVPESVLFLVGTGEKQADVEAYVRLLGLQDKVKFLGVRSDVNRLFQAMDAFVLPSLFEGVPVVGIEAQFASLPCYFSDKVPFEVSFTPECRFVSLQKSADEWAREVIEARNAQRTPFLEGNMHYNIHIAQKKLAERYIKLYESLGTEAIAK